MHHLRLNAHSFCIRSLGDGHAEEIDASQTNGIRAMLVEASQEHIGLNPVLCE